MYRIFNNPININIGTSVITGWHNTEKQLAFEFQKLFTYYRSNLNFLPASHPVVKLLELLSLTDGTAGEVADRVSAQAENMMSNLQIGSPSSRPDFTLGSHFFNSKTFEILLADDSIFNADEVYENWKEAKPIRILHHPFNDMSLGVPNGRYEGDNDFGYAVITINPAMLLIQYKGYLDSIRSNNMVNQVSVRTFAFQYPIINCMYDVLNIALRNRITASYLGRPLAPFTRRHPFSINNYTANIDKVIEVYIKNIGNQAMSMDKAIEAMPCYGINARATLAYPEILASRNTKWIMDVARAPLLEFLVAYNNRTPNYQNLDFLNQIKRAITVMETDKSIPTNADGVVYRPINHMKEMLSRI